MMGLISSDPALQAELQALREQVQALSAALAAAVASGLRVTLVADQAQPFLGQAVRITATVTGRDDGRPRPGVPLTLTASWGTLRPAAAEEAPGGSNLVLQTGLDGACRAILLPPTSEELLAGQQGALEAALAGLDATAATPKDAAAGLQELARQYRWEVNESLRRAVDIYFHDFHQDTTNSVNAHDYSQAWSFFTTTITAAAHEGDGGTVAGQAALALACKNWLAPWFQVFTSLTRDAGGLAQNLAEATLANLDPGPLLDEVYGRLHDFVGLQRGLAGEYAGRAVTQDALQNFAAGGLAQLSLETRVGVVPALLTTSGVVAKSGTSVVTALGEARADLRDQVQATATDLGQRVGDLSGKLAGKLDAAGLETALGGSTTIGGLRSGLAGKLDAGGFDAALANSAAFGKVQSGLAGKLDAAGLETALGNSATIGGLRTTLAAKLDATGLDEALKRSTVIGKIQDNLNRRPPLAVADLDPVLKESTVVAGLQSGLAGKLDAAGLETALANSATFGKKLDAAGLETALTNSATFGKVQGGLAGKLDAAGLDAALANSAAFGKKLDAAGLETALGSSAAFGKVQSSLAGKLDAAGLDAALANSTTVGTLRTTIAGKIDATSLENALANSATISGLRTTLGSKLDAAGLEDALNRSTVIKSIRDTQRRPLVAADLDPALQDSTVIAGLQSSVAGKADASALSALQTNLTTALGAKADATALTTLQTNLTTALQAKADANALTALQTNLTTALNNKADATRVQNLESDLGNVKNDVRTIRHIGPNIPPVVGPG